MTTSVSNRLLWWSFGLNLRDDECGSVFTQSLEALLNHVLSISINGTCSFIEENDLWLLQHGTSNGNTLLLATRQLPVSKLVSFLLAKGRINLHSSVTNFGVIACQEVSAALWTNTPVNLPSGKDMILS